MGAPDVHPYVPSQNYFAAAIKLPCCSPTSRTPCLAWGSLRRLSYLQIDSKAALDHLTDCLNLEELEPNGSPPHYGA